MDQFVVKALREVGTLPAFGNIVSGVFQPLLGKHSSRFSPVDAIAIGVDRM